MIRPVSFTSQSSSVESPPAAPAPSPESRLSPSFMDRLLSSASTLVGGGDPEAASAAQASQAMEPVTGPYLADVAYGRMAASGMPQSFYDPSRMSTPERRCIGGPE